MAIFQWTNENEIESGYFWEVPADNPLVRLGVIDSVKSDSIWIGRDFARQTKEEAEKWPSFLEQTGGFLTWVKETVEEPLKEIQEGVFNIWRDVISISKWDIKNAPWLIGDFARATRKGADKIQKLNAAIDETWGDSVDKAIWFWLTIFWELVEFWGDVIMSGIKTIAPESLEVATEEGIKEFVQSEFWQDVIWFAKEGWEKWKQFKASSPAANTFWLQVEAALPFAEVLTGWVITKTIKEIGWELLETGVKKSWELFKTAKEWFEVGRKELENIFKTTSEGKKIKADIESIKSMWTKDIPTSFRNKQAESIIADTNSMLPLDKQNFKQIAGKDYQTWLNERGFRGTGEENVDLLAKKFIKEKNAIDSALAQVPWRHNPDSLKPIMDEVLEFAIATENKANVSFIQWVKKWIEETGWASAKDIRKIKQIYERENKFSYMKDTDSVKTNRATNRDKELREDLITIAEDFWLELRDVSRELQQTVAIMNGLGKKLGRQTDGNVFDISDRVVWPLGAVEPTILLWLGGKKILTSDALKSAVAKILGNANIKIPTLKEPRLRQKIKEYEALQKEIKKATKKAKKQDELEVKRQEILEMVTPSSQKKLEVWRRVTPQDVEKGIISESKKELKNLTK